jgi:hypothetical protein
MDLMGSRVTKMRSRLSRNQLHLSFRRFSNCAEYSTTSDSRNKQPCSELKVAVEYVAGDVNWADGEIALGGRPSPG